MSGYWPWWAGALALGAITVGYGLWTGRGLGISGAWAKVVHWRRQRRAEQADALVDEAQLRAMLASATAEAFGDRPPAGRVGVLSRPARSAPVPERPMPLICYAALLAFTFLGGLLGAVTSGRFEVRWDMGEGFRDVVTGSRAGMVVLLFLGGVLVGFGTRMAGGCSSGHGLTGCSRLQPISIVATAVFFGSAVVMSWLLWKVI